MPMLPGRSVLLHAAMVMGLVSSTAYAQSTQIAPYSGDCSTLWIVAQANSKDVKATNSELYWAALKQLEKKECLKDEAKNSTAQSLARTAERLISDELRQRAPDERVLLHLTDLCSVQISAKAYDDVVATYQRMETLLKETQAARRFRSKQRWFGYVEMVVASAFAMNKIDTGLKIAESEIKAEKDTPPALQGRFAAKIGDLLLSRVRVPDALRFYALAVRLDKNGKRAQRALYWQTLDLYRRGETKAAREMFAQCKAATSEPELRSRISVLQSIVASEPGAKVDYNGKDQEYLQVWRDIRLVGQR